MKLNVNGVEVEVDDRFANTPLLWVLRDVLGLRGTKFGCGAGLCAACTVLIDGHNVKSCQTTPRRAVDKTITTVEGVSGPVVDAVRDAWYRGNVVQCGYCQPAQTLTAVPLLGSNPAPDDDAIDAAMSGNICRCGTYPRIRAAIVEAAKPLANAIAALTGTRIRRLPLAKTIGFQWGKENTSDITITASEDGPYLVSGRSAPHRPGRTRNRPALRAAPLPVRAVE